MSGMETAAGMLMGCGQLANQANASLTSELKMLPLIFTAHLF